MVIQRIQTLFLAIATLLMGALCFFIPIGSINLEGISANVYLYDDWSMIIVGLLATVLLFTDIFLYNKIKFQMTICALSSLFVIFTYILMVWIVLMFKPEVQLNWVFPSLICGVSLILSLAARSRMKADYNLLRSYDRLR